MWGNRLKAWKTIPICRRTPVDVDAARGDLVARDDDPPGIDRLDEVDAAQERRLATPRRADEAHDLVLGDAQVDPAKDLVLAEGLVESLDLEGGARRLGHRAPPAWRLRSRATSQSVSRASGIVTMNEDERHVEERREIEGRRLEDLRLAEDLDDAEDRDEDRVLLQPDEVVEERRDDPPDGLRDDDVAERLEPAQPERARSRFLAPVDRFDARPVDLRDIRGVDQGQAEHA